MVESNINIEEQALKQSHKKPPDLLSTRFLLFEMYINWKFVQKVMPAQLIINGIATFFLSLFSKLFFNITNSKTILNSSAHLTNLS